MIRYLLPITMLYGCGPIPISVTKTSQEQSQRVSNELSQDQQQAQQSSHASESKQGTNSMPVIIICNSNNSPYSQCATPRENGVLSDAIDNQLKRSTK